MGVYPINLELTNRPVVIVGGGRVATRKARRICQAGGTLTVIAPIPGPEMRNLCRSYRARIVEREYREGDLCGAFLVLAATDDHALNLKVVQDAGGLGILASRVDQQTSSDFSTPAMVSRGDFLITVSTGGKSPALSRLVEEELAARYGEEYAEATRILGEVREKLLTEKGENAYNSTVLSGLARRNLPQLLKNSQFDEIDRILRELFGQGFTLNELRRGEKDNR